MKNRFFKVISLAAALLGAVACDDVLGIIEEFGGDTNNLTEISITPASVTIKAEGGQASIAFEAPSTWSVSSAENWLAFDPAIGTSGEVVVTITAQPNTGAERRATVTVESGKLKATATVIQEGEGGNTQPGDSTTVNPVTDPEGWYLIGTFNEWDVPNSVDMAKTADGVYTVSITFPEKTEFKFLKGRDPDWKVNLGGVEYDSSNGANVSPAIKAGDTIALMQDGSNLYFIPGGDVTITLDVNNNTAVLTGGNPQPEDPPVVDPPVDPVPEGAVWSIVGTVSGYDWNTDMPMLHIQELNTGKSYWYGVFYYKLGEEFKLRANGEWEYNRGAGAITTDAGQNATFNAIPNGANIIFDKEGVYELFYYPDTETITVRLPYNQAWSIIGEIEGQNWDVDNEMLPNIREDAAGKTHVYFCGQIDYAGEEFKIRYNRAWEFDFGMPWEYEGSPWGDQDIPLVVRGQNIDIYVDAGKYYVLIDPLEQILWLEDENGNRPEVHESDHVVHARAGLSRNGFVPIELYVGNAVEYVKYVVVNGAYEDHEAAWSIATEILEGTIETKEFRDFVYDETLDQRVGKLNITRETEGYVTFVCIGFDAEDNSEYWSFYYQYVIPFDSERTWTSLGTVTYTDDIIASLYDFLGAEVLTWEVELQQCDQDPSVIRMVYPYDGKYPYNDPGDYYTDKSYDIEINIADENHVFIYPQEIGVDWGEGMVSMASSIGFYRACGASLNELWNEELFGVLHPEGYITFPIDAMVANLYHESYFFNWWICNRHGGFKLTLPNYEATTEPVSAPASVSKRQVRRPGYGVLRMEEKRGGDGQSLRIK